MADVVDLSGLVPPLTPAENADAFGMAGAAAAHTYAPFLLSQEEFNRDILPRLERSLQPELVAFLRGRVERTFALRERLRRLEPDITAIVGKGNFSALWLDRHAYSADSMEHRAVVTEAVVRVYSASALQRLVHLFAQNDVPMIPYGEGGGYNMGVTPMAPAVTVSLRGIDHISPVRPSRRTPGRFEVSVGAGVPFKDLIEYLARRGYVLRCDPNTPRAATGGIAATGSNGGRKAFEVIVHGRAVTHDGAAVTFAPDETEARDIASEPFLLARKFFSISEPAQLAKRLSTFRGAPACVDRECETVVVPLAGIKGEANMLAQRALRANEPRVSRELDELAPLPLSAFVGAEGCTGFIYEVTFEIERPLPFVKGLRWHFGSVAAAMDLTRALKARPAEEQPVFLEYLSGQSIARFLRGDFPDVFPEGTEACLIAAVEGATREECEERAAFFGEIANRLVPLKVDATAVLPNGRHVPELEELKRPREELPKKLRTKCKTDMEIRTEYLPAVLELVARSQPRRLAKEDVLFGHLTPAHTAIMHWNIGGFDLYDEEQADVAWEYLERVIDGAQRLAPEGDPHGSARFTGEHGLAGKAAFLWLNHIPPEDFERMCAVKDILDPGDLFNPDTIFLRTSHARSLRARLLALTSERLRQARAEAVLYPAEQFVVNEALRCTRCNSCKVCPVIDAEHALARKGEGGKKRSVLPSKRDLVMFLESMVMARRAGALAGRGEAVEDATRNMLAQSKELLRKCFYCRRCDKACPVDIQIHPLMKAYHEMGRLPSGSRFWEFVYDRMMGRDRFKELTFRLIGFVLLLSRPILAFLRSLTFLPRWLKTYFAPPTVATSFYEPLREGIKASREDNFVHVGRATASVQAHDHLPEGMIYLRFRGCFDTFGNPEATRAVDVYFSEFLGARIVDLEKKMCCGFPYEADGLHEKAKALQLDCLVDIAEAIARLQSRSRAPVQVTLFSSCPTCAEALREIRELAHDDSRWAVVCERARLPQGFPRELMNFRVTDTAELAVEVLAACPEREATIARVERRVGLKIPCHNTEAATAAQLALLRRHFTEVFGYDRCCGLSGTGRLKHPKIGTEIAESLFEQMAENPPEVCVSGCPSCRDGVKMQRDINRGEGRALGDFEVRGIFEEIVRGKDGGR